VCKKEAPGFRPDPCGHKYSTCDGSSGADKGKPPALLGVLSWEARPWAHSLTRI